MSKEVIGVIGSRDFDDYELLKTVLQGYDIDTIISGGAKGADSLAEKYARANEIHLRVIYPLWESHGNAAGFIRNEEIVTSSSKVVAFWDGKSQGTKHSIDLCDEHQIDIEIVAF